MSDTIETINYNNHTIAIKFDFSAESPRAFDNLGTIVAFTSRCNYSDYNAKNMTIEEAREICKNKKFVCFPLYKYEHSAVALSLFGNVYPFNDRWDAGQIGVMFCSKKKILKTFNKKKVSRKLEEKIKNIFENELKQYTQYINFNVYYITIDDDEYSTNLYGTSELKTAIENAKIEIDTNYNK